MKDIVIFWVFVVISMVVMNATIAFAGETTLRVKATVVQCGAPEQIEQACMENSLCCRFVDQVAAARAAEESPEKGAALFAAIKNAETAVAHNEAAAEADIRIKVVTGQDTFFDTHDLDGSGEVTLDEFTAMSAKATPAVFARLDRNANGALSKPELSKFRAAMNS